MADLDEVSKQIGQLISMAESGRNQVGTLFAKFDKINEEVIEQRGALKLLGSSFHDHLATDMAAHKKFEETSAEFQEYKNKGKGALWVFGGMGGVGMFSGIWAAFKAWALSHGAP